MPRNNRKDVKSESRSDFIPLLTNPVRIRSRGGSLRSEKTAQGGRKGACESAMGAGDAGAPPA